MWSPYTCTERAIVLGALAVCVFAGSARPVRAQDWERLIMPGPLAKAHAELEDDCAKCHTPFRRTEQRDQCLSCHDHSLVKADIGAGMGFHGLSNARTAECATCHTEHIGRDGDILGLARETFDHRRTDFPLHGRHVGVDCAECHEAEKPFRSAPGDCFACHRDDDAHDGSLGRDCAKCHDAKAWRGGEFDHDKTRFPLEGEHRDVACASCHTSQRYEEAPSECSSCHALDDVHSGRFGTDCAKCHGPAAWKRIAFDHSVDTRFPLRGAHAKQRCEGCHTSNPYEDKLLRNCWACHAADDEHKGRFGRKCEQCHVPKRWVDDKFDHRETEFPLVGVHQTVACVTCHTDVIGESKLARDCASCHLVDDVHAKQLGKDCARCHQPAGWTREVFFDHDLSRFPLLGLHAIAACEACHATRKFQDVEFECVECHEGDDFHDGRMGIACADCHNPNGWAFWDFDHAKRTGFLLEEGHAGLACQSCHSRATDGKVAQSKECSACHRDDDVHAGSFGRNCARCHDTTAWDRVRPMQ